MLGEGLERPFERYINWVEEDLIQAAEHAENEQTKRKNFRKKKLGKMGKKTGARENCLVGSLTIRWKLFVIPYCGLLLTGSIETLSRGGELVDGGCLKSVLENERKRRWMKRDRQRSMG